ncbi:hypothetical protein HQ560_10950 [bacterium]|nr:hypothetical protein [bacterium]
MQQASPSFLPTKASMLFAGAFCFCISVVLLSVTRAEQQTFDSLCYALSIKTNTRIFHPHHLLFAPIVRVLLRGASALGGTQDAVLWAQVHNVFWAGITVSAVCILSIRLFGSVGLGIATALTLLVSYGFWRFSTQVEVYVPATGCLAALLLLMDWHRAALTWSSKFGIAALLAGAIFYHQTNVLFCVPLVVWMLMAFGWRRGSRASAQVIGAAGATVLAAYIVAYCAQDTLVVSGFDAGKARGAGGFIRYCMAYTHSEEAWGVGSYVSLSGAFAEAGSQLRAFVYPPHRGRAVAIGLASALLIVMVCWHSIKAVRSASLREHRVTLLTWLVVYYLFFLWWLPFDQEFFITPLVPLVLLGFIAVRDLTLVAPKPRAASMVALVGSLIFVAALGYRNGGHIVRAGTEPDHAYGEAEFLNSQAPPTACIISESKTCLHLQLDFDRNKSRCIPCSDIEQPGYLAYLLKRIESCGELELIVPAGVAGRLADEMPLDAAAGLPSPSARVALLFGVRRDAVGTLRSYRRIGRVVEIGDQVYMALPRHPAPPRGVADLLRELDRMQQPAASEDLRRLRVVLEQLASAPDP